MEAALQLLPLFISCIELSDSCRALWRASSSWRFSPHFDPATQDMRLMQIVLLRDFQPFRIENQICIASS